MFIGHYAVAFGAKRFWPRVSLGILLLAATWIDLLWPVFLLLGWERVYVDPGNTAFTPLNFAHYPITHSLLGASAWSAALGLLYWFFQRQPGESVVVALLSLSHWFLDVLVHRPDLPLYPGGTKVGAGLWNFVPATIVLELSMFGLSLWLYGSATKSGDRIGTVGLWTFVATTLLIYIGNVSGPPPPSSNAVAVLGLGAWLIPLWAGWFNRHRALRRESF